MSDTKARNIPLMYAVQLLHGMLFFLPVLALYFEERLFTVTNVALVFSVQAIAMALFEVPTGAIADLFGRRKTLIVSFSINTFALLIMFSGKTLTAFIIYAVLIAFARSLESGTQNALVYDTLKELGREKEYKKIIGRFLALWPLGAVIGSLIGGVLATYSLTSTVLYTMIPVSTAWMMTFFLKEPIYQKEQHMNVIRHMRESFNIVIKNKQLIILFIGGFIMWGVGEIIHRLNSLFFTFKEIPLAYFGIISALVFGFSSLGHYYGHAVSERIGSRNTLIFASIGSILVLFAATLMESFTMIAFWTVASIFFGLRGTVTDYLINKETSSNKRATINSTYNLFTKLGFAIFSIIIGYWAELFTISTAVKLGVAIMVVAPVTYWFLKKE